MEDSDPLSINLLDYFSYTLSNGDTCNEVANGTWMDSI